MANILQLLRDLAYQGRFSEGFRILAKSPDKNVGFIYLKKHGLNKLERKKSFWTTGLLQNPYLKGDGRSYGYGPYANIELKVTSVFEDGIGYGYGYHIVFTTNCQPLGGSGTGNRYGYGHGRGQTFNRREINKVL